MLIVVPLCRRNGHVLTNSKCCFVHCRQHRCNFVQVRHWLQHEIEVQLLEEDCVVAIFSSEIRYLGIWLFCRYCYWSVTSISCHISWRKCSTCCWDGSFSHDAGPLHSELRRPVREPKCQIIIFGLQIC